MTRLAWPLLLAIAGCTDGGADEDYPVAPGGDTTGPIGGSTDGDGSEITRRICISNSLQNLGQCRQNNLSGFQVTLGGRSATTDATGSFTLPAPSGTDASFTVSGPGAVTTTSRYSAALTVPVVDADVYARTLASHQVFGTAGAGAILGNIAPGGGPRSGYTVASTPTSSYASFYDNESGTTFGNTATGSRGVFWIPGITAGMTSIAFRSPSGGETTVGGVQVVNGGVTILDSVPLP